MNNPKYIDELNNLLGNLDKIPSFSMFKELTEGSYRCKALIGSGDIVIAVFLNNEKLKYDVIFSDPTEWIYRLTPLVAFMLNKNTKLIPKSSKLKFNITSESEYWSASCPAEKIIEMFKSGNLNEFGAILACFDHDTV
jgi:hypothetical protein